MAQKSDDVARERSPNMRMMHSHQCTSSHLKSGSVVLIASTVCCASVGFAEGVVADSEVHPATGAASTCGPTRTEKRRGTVLTKKKMANT